MLYKFIKYANENHITSKQTVQEHSNIIFINIDISLGKL